MSVLNGHKFIIIGDSYTVGITAGGGTIDSWLDYFVRWYGNEWAGYFKSAEGGYGFAKPNYTFLSLLNALDNTISDKTAITDILVAGGYNDHSYVSSLASAIGTFKQTANTKYPNATLWIAPIGWTTNEYQNQVAQVIEGYITWGKEYGFRVLEEMKNVMRNTSRMSADEIHPNESGYKALAENMHRYLVSYLSEPKIRYTGSDKWKIRATELLNEGSGGGGGGLVDDVKVNGTSVVDENKVAQIDLSEYATQSYVTNALDDYTTMAVLQANYYNKTEVDTALQSKANANSVYTKTEADTLLSAKANASDVYAKSETYSDDEVDALLSAKQDSLTAGTNISINANNEISAVDTNTTYTLTVSGNNIVLTPSSGSANTITVPYATNAGTVNGHSVDKDVPSNAVFTDNDTKNTAGSTNTSSKIYLIGATSQGANPQTYSHDTAYVGTDGCLYSGGTKVLTEHQDISGKVSKSGDIMSGALTMNNVNANVKDTNISTGSNPSSDVWGNGFILLENGGADIGHFRAVKLTSGNQGLQLEAQRVVSNSNKYNALNLYIDTSGNAVVQISGTGAAASWRSAIGAVQKRWVSLTGSSLLAKNAVGNTVSLSENLNNFQFLAIRWGADTDQAAGGGQFWQYIPTANCGTNSQHGFTYQNNGTVAYPTIQFTSATALKILHTRVGSTSGGTLPGNGLRAVYGVNY
ncbi:MAG: SGNH/GDSL hydrolase family protein [Eubacterium sp.]|nr:SGNH/GDSL hydrolase family protein [Eubacterium sp.]